MNREPEETRKMKSAENLEEARKTKASQLKNVPQDGRQASREEEEVPSSFSLLCLVSSSSQEPECSLPSLAPQ